MNIQHPEDPCGLTFGDLKPGDVFKDSFGDVCIKADEDGDFMDVDGDPVTSFVASTGITMAGDNDDDPVVWYPDAVLTLGFGT